MNNRYLKIFFPASLLVNISSRINFNHKKIVIDSKPRPISDEQNEAKRKKNNKGPKTTTRNKEFWNGLLHPQDEHTAFIQKLPKTIQRSTIFWASPCNPQLIFILNSKKTETTKKQISFSLPEAPWMKHQRNLFNWNQWTFDFSTCDKTEKA